MAPAPDYLLLHRILHLHSQISNLPSLYPSDTVNSLFSQLVALCIRPCSIDFTQLPENVHKIRPHLVQLCARAEELLERHYSELLGRLPDPFSQLHQFPYYENYLKLALLEYRLLCQSAITMPKRVAFVGSGPMPLSSIVLARHHWPSTMFDNYDMDADANRLARELLRGQTDLSTRLTFHTRNITKEEERLGEYDVVFLAGLVGMDRDSKMQILKHLARHMRSGSTLVVRSASGARTFLYPVVDKEMLQTVGFESMLIFHPTDEVINSVIVARRSSVTIHSCSKFN